MTYHPGEALRNLGWFNSHRFDSFTPEIVPIRDLVAICGPEGAARRMRIEERELNQFLAAGEAPIAYVGVAFIILRRRLTRQQATLHAEVVCPENRQLRSSADRVTRRTGAMLH